MVRVLPQASQARSPAALSGRARERGAPARRLGALRDREQVEEAVARQEFWVQQPVPFFQMVKALGLEPAKARAAREREPVAAREPAGPGPEELAQFAVLASSNH